MMPGSDDEFSDCDLEDEDENDNVSDELNTPPSQTQQASTLASTVPPLPTDWLLLDTISDFDSPVGPVPETSSDLMFTPFLMDMIVATA